MINVLAVPRDDFYEVRGGDRVMLEKIQAHTQSHGVDIHIHLANELNEVNKNIDALYITQVFQLSSLNKALEWAKIYQIPVFLSPLAEDGLPQWFHEASKSVAKWRILVNVLGSQNAENAYISWRYLRRKRSAKWRATRDVLASVFLVPNSQAELDHLCDWYDLTSPSAAIVPLGIDKTVFSRSLNHKPQVLDMDLHDYILEVGSICRRKNQLGLLKACFHRPELIVFLGKPSPYEFDYYDELVSLASRRGRVVFLEWINECELPGLYANAKVHVLPSWSERPGLVTLEAVVAGSPVVSTQFSPIRDYLGDGVVLCNPRFADSITSAIDLAIGNPPSIELREKVLQSYTWHKTGERFAKIIMGHLKLNRAYSLSH